MAASILRRCLLSVLLSWAAACTDLYIIVQTWMLYTSCKDVSLGGSSLDVMSTGVGRAIRLDSSNVHQVIRLRQGHEKCGGRWGSYYILHDYSIWAIVATSAFVVGPLVEAVVDGVLSYKQHPAAAAAASAQGIATVATLGLSVKTRRLLSVRQAQQDGTLLAAAGRRKVAQLYAVKVVEVLTKGIMIAFAATLYVLADTTAMKDGQAGATSSSRGLLAVLHDNTSPRPYSPPPAPGAPNNVHGSFDDIIRSPAPSGAPNNRFGSFGSDDSSGRKRLPFHWEVAVEALVALLAAANAAAGFTWHCPASAWSTDPTNNSSANQPGTTGSLGARAAAYIRDRLPLAFFPMFLFQCAAIFCGGSVYIHLAQHLWAMLRDPRLAFLLLVGRWGCQVLLLWLLCMHPAAAP
jgi:hypothetical protein